MLRQLGSCSIDFHSFWPKRDSSTTNRSNTSVKCNATILVRNTIVILYGSRRVAMNGSLSLVSVPTFAHTQNQELIILALHLVCTSLADSCNSEIAKKALRNTHAQTHTSSTPPGRPASSSLSSAAESTTSLGLPAPLWCSCCPAFLVIILLLLLLLLFWLLLEDWFSLCSDKDESSSNSSSILVILDSVYLLPTLH